MTLNQKQAVSTKNAPQAIGPYSQAIRVGDLLFLSGQVCLDPSGNLVQGAIEEQTERVMKNVLGVLESQGLNAANLVKTTVFLKNMADFVKFNEVYSKFLEAPYPARSTIEVARLPKDVLVEIEAIAVFPNT